LAIKRLRQRVMIFDGPDHADIEQLSL